MRSGGLGIAFALCFALAFPFRGGDFSIDLGWAFGWIALIPFALALRDRTPAAAFRWALLWSTLALCLALFWIYVAVAVFGGAAPPQAALAVVLLAIVLALHVAAFAALARKLEAWAGALAFAVLPVAWVAAEQLRGVLVFGGFPWAFLGHTAHANGPMRELAAFGGVFGLSLLMAIFASLVARRRFPQAAALLALSHLVGFAVGLTKLGNGAESPSSVAIIQANIPQDQKLDARGENFAKHLEWSRLAAASAEFDLMIWPEAAVLLSLEEGGARSEIQALARELDASLLVGGIALEPGQRGDGFDYRVFNSLYAVDRAGQFVDRYDKSKLVPFGEYVPLRWLLDPILDAVATSVGTITPGTGPRPLAELPSYAADAGLAPLICYEVVYPSLVRRAVQSGARILVNVTNDAWYGRTSGPHQFLAIAAMRSAEHGLPMLRAANTGVSAIIDPSGRVMRRTRLFEEHALVGEVPAPRSGVTLYTRFGDWVAWLCWGLLGVLYIGSLGGIQRVRASGSQRNSRDPGRVESARGSDPGTPEASLTSTENSKR